MKYIPFLTLIIFSHAKSAKSAKFYSLFLFHACAGVVANFVTTRVRRVVSSKFSSSSSFPLRPLREIKIRAFCFARKDRKERKVYSLSCFTLALEGSQTSLRQESAESFIHPLPPAGYSRLSQGESQLQPQAPRQQTVPLRQAGRGAKRRRGWIYRSPLTFNL